MTNSFGVPQLSHPNTTEADYDKTIFGFWVYLMTDCILFATLFAVYAALRNNIYGGPSAQDLFNLRFALIETLILLTSSFSCGIAMLSLQKNEKNKVLAWFAFTCLLGISFLVMEITEFSHFIHQGNSWSKSAFLSSFFTLVGTHGLHITAGLIWMIVLMVQVGVKGLTPFTVRRLTCLRMFWHFLDIIWIFIFSFVYLMGAEGI